MKNKAKFMKKFKYGTIAAITTAIVIAIVIVVNVMMSMVTAKYPVKFDLTQDKRYELSQESIDFLKTLGNDVEIAVTMTEEELTQGGYYFTDTYRRIPTEIIPQFLEKYEMYSSDADGSVEIRYIDIEKNPDEISKYSELYNGTISSQQVIIYANERVKVLSFGSLFTQSNSQYTATDSTDSGVIFTGESVITSAIMSVTDANPVNAGMIYMMNGQAIFSQTSYNSIIQLYSLLGSNGYNMTDVDIATDELSTEDYDLLIIAAPEIDFTEDAISKLEDFLYNDGNYQKNIIYISSIVSAELPNIEAFLEKWNVKVEDSLVFDDKNSQYVNTASASTIMAPSATIIDEETASNLTNTALPIVAPYSRAITVADKNNDIAANVILQSSATSYRNTLETLEDESAKSDEGVNNLMTISTRSRGEQFDVYESHLMVVGCMMLTDPNIIAQTTAYNNANFMLNTINTMTGKENSVVIPQKNLQQVIITVDNGQLSALRSTIMYIIPGIVVICGIVVFIRRKNK